MEPAGTRGSRQHVKKVWTGVGFINESSYIKVMKDMKKIIKKLEEVKNLLELNLEASNMDVEYMLQRVEDMIEEFEEVGEFKFEEEVD
jgi:hypothetical protein